MKIILCDDDKKDMERLKQLLLAYDKERGIGFFIDTYTSGSELLKAIGKERMDIFFLDINMKNMDGLALATKIRERLEDVPIILVTAYINYAIEGYKVRVDRFLVKDDLEKTIVECMNDICAQIQKKQKNILFTCVEGNINIRLSEIFYVEVSGHKSILHLTGQEYHIYETMEQMEVRLKPYGFARAHQSYLVNMRHIRKINNYLLTLDNGKEIQVPKGRYKLLRYEYALFAGNSL